MEVEAQLLLQPPCTAPWAQPARCHAAAGSPADERCAPPTHPPAHPTPTSRPAPSNRRPNHPARPPLQAADSDQKVITKLMDSDAAFSALTPEAAAAQMPRLQAPLVNVAAEDPAVVVANLRRCGPARPPARPAAQPRHCAAAVDHALQP